MTRMIGIHEFDLRPGVTDAELEQAIRALATQPCPSGWRASLLKSDRGTRRGKYGLLFEVESVEARDRIVTDAGFSDVFNQFLAANPGWLPAWEHMLSLVVEPNPWNDYLVL